MAELHKYEGKIVFGDLPADARERLAKVPAQWLEFVPNDSAAVVRHVQPGGCPAISAVACELIRMLDTVPAGFRDQVPGGQLLVSGLSGGVVRIAVQQGEVRVQWPHKDYQRGTVMPLKEAMLEVNACESRVDGAVKFGGTAASFEELRTFVDGFEGLYPAGRLTPTYDKDLVRVEFGEVNVDPTELVAKLSKLATPPQTLEGELEISSFVPAAIDHDFHIHLRGGEVRAIRPALWKDPQTNS